MKKLLIPILGLFALILATPLILSKLSNSNLDSMLVNLEKNGVQITNIKKHITYFSSNRSFTVVLDKNTKLKIYKPYKKLIDNVSFDVNLSFSNMPVTSAIFYIHINQIKTKNKEYLKGLNIVLVSKNLKKFEYVVKNYKSKNIEITAKNGKGNIKELDKKVYLFIRKMVQK